jgi:hypothetical protein
MQKDRARSQRWSGCATNETVRVPAGGTASNDYWCQDFEATSGGTYNVVWTGQDTGGHAVDISYSVYLKP